MTHEIAILKSQSKKERKTEKVNGKDTSTLHIDSAAHDLI